jgi:hypothetical protein
MVQSQFIFNNLGLSPFAAFLCAWFDPLAPGEPHRVLGIGGFLAMLRKSSRIALVSASLFWPSLAGASVWINQGYSRPIDPGTNMPVPLANLTDFHMELNVTGSKPPGQGNPAPLTVPNRINGGNAKRDAVASDPQFGPAAVKPLVITPGVPAGGVRTDAVELNWDRVNNPIVIGASGYLKFGAEFQTNGAKAQITKAQWTTSVAGLPTVTAPSKGTWDFTVPQNRGNGFSFSYTDEEAPMTLTGPDGTGPIHFESRPTELPLDALDPNDTLGGTSFSPDGATLNGIPISPSQSSYSLSLGDTLTFTYSGVIDPFVTVQGLQSYTGPNGDFAAFAVEATEVPEPVGLSVVGLGCVGLFLSRRRCSRS